MDKGGLQNQNRLNRISTESTSEFKDYMDEIIHHINRI